MGIALSFCDSEEKTYLRDIHRLIKSAIPVISDHPYHVEPPPVGPKPPTGAPAGTPFVRKKGGMRMRMRMRM
jgi:ATP-dependent RNA helicase RhlE